MAHKHCSTAPPISSRRQIKPSIPPRYAVATAPYPSIGKYRECSLAWVEGPIAPTSVVSQPAYVVIDLSCVTVSQCHGPLVVAIWEHTCDGQIKNDSIANDT